MEKMSWIKGKMSTSISGKWMVLHDNNDLFPQYNKKKYFFLPEWQSKRGKVCLSGKEKNSMIDRKGQKEMNVIEDVWINQRKQIKF